MIINKEFGLNKTDNPLQGSYIVNELCDIVEEALLSELERMMTKCFELGADIAKIACMVQSEEDNANLLALYSGNGRKVIIGMGNLGKITRLAALKLGAEFTFVSSDEEHSTAPGQMTYNEFTALNKIL